MTDLQQQEQGGAELAAARIPLPTPPDGDTPGPKGGRRWIVWRRDEPAEADIHGGGYALGADRRRRYTRVKTRSRHRSAMADRALLAAEHMAYRLLLTGGLALCWYGWHGLRWWLLIPGCMLAMYAASWFTLHRLEHARTRRDAPRNHY